MSAGPLVLIALALSAAIGVLLTLHGARRTARRALRITALATLQTPNAAGMGGVDSQEDPDA